MNPKLTLFLFSFFFVTASLFSQTNTSSLSCWETHRGGTFQTRHAKTPLAQSSAGSAYAEVTAEASTDSGQAQFCKNRVQVFYSKSGNDYKVVYEKAGLDDQGVGVRVLGWSRNGLQLLMELSVWGYDNDHDVVKSAMVFDSGSLQTKELPLGDAFERVFGKDCEFDSSVVGWQGDDNVMIRVGRTSATTRYQQTFCVEKPTLYNFNLREGKVLGGKP